MSYSPKVDPRVISGVQNSAYKNGIELARGGDVRASG
jgi:hypothetical protein